MKIAILITSERKNGNCDLLGRYANRFIGEQGCQSKLIYLKDFEIRECQGCMSCVFKNIKCKIDDNLYELADKIADADGILLLAPTYVLTIPGKLKMVLDRFLCFYSIFKDKPERPAVSIGVASPIDWNQFQLPLMNMFLLALGCRIVDSYFIFGAGQGEALLKDGIKRVENSIRNLIDHQAKPYVSQVSKYCPVDFCRLFEKVKGDIYRCPVCLTPAVAKEDGFHFDARDLNNHRWTKENLKEHFENWILKTKSRFKELLPQIYQKKKEFGLR